MTIETFTVNAVEYQSYVTIEEIDGYYGLDQDNAVFVLTEDEKKVLAISATRRIDLIHFKGAKKTEDQKTKFPRTPYDLPYDVELACMLLMNIIRFDSAAGLSASYNANVQRVRAGSVEVYFFEPDNKALTSEEFSITDPTIRRLLLPYIAVTDSSADEAIVTGAAYGTKGESFFDRPNQYFRGVY